MLPGLGERPGRRPSARHRLYTLNLVGAAATPSIDTNIVQCQPFQELLWALGRLRGTKHLVSI